LADVLVEALTAGLATLWSYIAEHTVFCLIPAFFIAGAISALLKKDAILKYLGSDVRPWISYSLASVSGTVLAVCSCTILPLFQGIYKKGAGLGPATAFLYAGPAINILAIVYTARLLGPGLGAARAVAAIGLSVVIGAFMALIFRKGEKKKQAEEAKKARKAKKAALEGPKKDGKPRWVTPTLFLLMVAILVIGTASLFIFLRLGIVFMLLAAVVYLAAQYHNKDELSSWGYETWDLAKKIFPVLLTGAFLVGLIAYFVPPETFRPYIGGNSLGACFMAAVIGALLYMPTLLEVPIIGTTLGYSHGVMGGGPALALLLSGPAVSLPSMLVLYRLVGAKKTIAYVLLVILTSAFAGFAYGVMAG
jgi:uncharacterized membrane protein YraQ (UPF0718 family)